MKRFEYKTVVLSGKGIVTTRLDAGIIDKTLNKYGEEGWELVSVKIGIQGFGVSNGVLCVFKRCCSTKFIHRHVKLVDN